MSTAPSFAATLRESALLLGTLIVSPSPRWPEAAARAGLDFVFLDTEHVALDRTQLSWMCQTYRALGLPPLVRIPSPDPFAAAMALDGGAAGVVAPYLETVEQVRALVAAVKQRPIKGARLVRGDFEPALENYLTRNAGLAAVANIESAPALDMIDDLVRVPGLDAVLIGPHDLSCSLGLPEEYAHPRFLAATERIFRAARAAGIGAGIHFTGEPAELQRFAAQGANFLIHASDIGLFTKHLARDLRTLRGKAAQENEHAPHV